MCEVFGRTTLHSLRQKRRTTRGPGRDGGDSRKTIVANFFDSKCSPRVANFLWVNLTRATHTALGESVGREFDVHTVREPRQIPDAVRVHAPLFICFEFDEPSEAGMATLAQVRSSHPSLPVLMIAGRACQTVVLWALRIRVWDLLVKPVAKEDMRLRLIALIELMRQRGSGPLRDIRFPSLDSEAAPVNNNLHQRGKTHPAVVRVAMHFGSKIALNDVAALCRLSPSRFCHVFKQEHGESFSQYLLRYRIEQACDHLADPAARAKDVAYAVGFNDVSYFTRAFKRQLGVSPGKYRATAKLS